MRKTSIIILSYNTLEYLKLCIYSIRKYTDGISYELIVVDNGSHDGSVDWLKKQDDIRCICNKTNKGFPCGCNQGLSIATGTELLLLNSDTIVTPRWLQQMLAALYSTDKIGAVSCVTTASPNQHVDTDGYNDVNGLEKFADKYNHTDKSKWKRVTCLMGFCFLFRREIYDKIGGLDEYFSPGYCEDDDYSLRILQLGYSLLVCEDTFIHHFGSLSFKKKDKMKQEKNKFRTNSMHQNGLRKFREKWDVSNRFYSMNIEEFLHRQKMKYGESKRWQLNNHAIDIICFVKDNEKFEKTKYSVNALRVPKGFSLKITSVYDKKNIAETYQYVLERSTAKYKMYITEGTVIRNKNILLMMINMFQKHNEYGLLGICGSKDIPMTIEWRDGEIIKNSDTLQSTRVVDKNIIITQYDIDWRTDILSGNNLYAVSQCLEFMKNGLKIGVIPINSDDVICEDIKTSNSKDIIERKKFLLDYAHGVTRCYAYLPDNIIIYKVWQIIMKMMEKMKRVIRFEPQNPAFR